MKKIWQRIENWLEMNAPHIKASLLTGASDIEISTMENKIGVKLPQDMVEFYKIHNGQALYAEKLMDGEELLCLERIFSKWNNWNNLFIQGYFKPANELSGKNIPEKIRPCWWNPKWIPITSDDLENNCCLDLDPAHEGNYGQIIRVWYDHSSREVFSPSFLDWIKEYADNLEKGKYIYSKEYRGIIDKEFL